MSPVTTLDRHFRQAIKNDAAPVSRAQMVLCGLATGFPLFLGLYLHQLPISIFGALMGYFLTVNDHTGTLGHRLRVALVTFALLNLGFWCGLQLRTEPVFFLIALGVMTYWIGLLGGEGAELERAMQFSTIELVVAAQAMHLDLATFPAIFSYFAVGFAFVLITILARAFVWKDQPAPFSSLRQSFVKLWRLSPAIERHIHAFSYMAMAISCALIVERLHIERGYWAIISVLLVMKPDRAISMYRGAQRLVGTCLGVVISVGILYVVRSHIAIIGMITLCAYFVPWAIKKNYGLVAFWSSIMVILLLDLPSLQIGDWHTPLLRLETTALGCALGAVGVVLSRSLSYGARKAGISRPAAVNAPPAL